MVLGGCPRKARGNNVKTLANIAGDSMATGAIAHDCAAGTQPPRAVGDADSKCQVRSEERYGYQHIQRVVIMDGPRWPHPSEFFPVECRDLSRSGIGFYATTDLTGRNLLVELGREPSRLYMLAQVVHCRAVPGDPLLRYMVGCRFIKRVPYCSE